MGGLQEGGNSSVGEPCYGMWMLSDALSFWAAQSQ